MTPVGIISNLNFSFVEKKKKNITSDYPEN